MKDINNQAKKVASRYSNMQSTLKMLKDLEQQGVIETASYGISHSIMPDIKQAKIEITE